MDLNRVILIGRLASDPEKKYTPSGIAVTQFRLAVNRPMSAEARQSGQEKQTDFISIVAWRQSAEFAATYLSKGRLVAVEGRLQIREYVTQEGQKRREAEVVVDNLKSLDRPKEQEGGGGRYDNHEYQDHHAPPAQRSSNYGGGGGGYGGGGHEQRRQDPAPSGGYSNPPAEDDVDDPFADN